MEDNLLARCRMAIQDGAEALRLIEQARDDQRRLVAENWRICREYRARTGGAEVEIPSTTRDVPPAEEPCPDLVAIRVETDPATIELMQGLLTQAVRFVVGGGALGAAIALNAAVRSGVVPGDARAFLVALVMEQSAARPVRIQKRRVARARRHLVAAEKVAVEAARAVAALLSE